MASISIEFSNQGHAKPVNPLSVFGSVPIKFSSAHLKQLTRNAMAPFKEIREKCIRVVACDKHLPAAWRKTMNKARQLQGVEQLRWVNAQVNRLLRYRSDGHNDVWSSPLDSMKRGGGDCEDYALVKMWFLRNLGIDQIHIVVVDHPGSKTLHAVLAVKMGLVSYILDSRSSRVVVEDEIKEYVPIFSVGLNDTWVHGRCVDC